MQGLINNCQFAADIVENFDIVEVSNFHQKSDKIV